MHYNGRLTPVGAKISVEIDLFPVYDSIPPKAEVEWVVQRLQ